MTAYDTAVDVSTPRYHWKLGEASGTVADRKGNYPTALTAEGTITYGVAGLVPANNGTDTAVQLALTGDFFGSAFSRPTINIPQFAWICYFKVDASNPLSGFQYLCALSGTSTEHSGIALNGNKVEGFFKSGSTYITADTTTSVVVSGTYRASCSYDGAHLQVRLDAVTETSTASTATPVTSSALSAVIGADWPLTSRFIGTVDEVVFFNHALTAADDLVIFQAGNSSSSSRTASESLSLSDAATKTSAFARSATESLGLSDVATQSPLYARTAAEALGLDDAATRAAQTFTRTASDALSLSDAASVTALQTSLTATESLSLSDVATADVGGDLSRAVSESLSLSDVATATVALSVTAAEELVLSDSASAGGDEDEARSSALLSFYGR